MFYLDFALHVGPGIGGAHPVRVTDSPVGEVTGTMQFALDAAQLDTMLHGVQAAVTQSQQVTRDISTGEDDGPPPRAGVTAFGTQLFTALFTGPVLEAYQRSLAEARAAGGGLRVRLQLEAPDLAALPWEFLYDPAAGDFVCLSSETPLVRYLQVDRPLRPLRVTPPIRILGLVATPSDKPPLNAERERARLSEAIAALCEHGSITIDWLAGSTVADLQNALRRAEYHVFHFVGHGGFDPESGTGVLAFCDEAGKSQVVEAQAVARLLAREESLRLVVLNSCLGAKGSATDLFSSVAATLVRHGVPAVVAMQYEISDTAAVEFARGLYRAISDGLPIDAAVADARVALGAVARHSVEWGTPVLQMRSADGVLFRIASDAYGTHLPAEMRGVLPTEPPPTA